MNTTTQAAAGQVEKTVEQALNMPTWVLRLKIADALGWPIWHVSEVGIEARNNVFCAIGPYRHKESVFEYFKGYDVALCNVPNWPESWADAMALRDMFVGREWRFIRALLQVTRERTGNSYTLGEEVLMDIRPLDLARAFWLVCPAKTNVEGQG